MFATDEIMHQTISNNAKKSTEWQEYCKSRESDSPEMLFTLEEKEDAKLKLPGLIKSNIQRLVDLRDTTLIAPYRKLVEMGLVEE